MSLPAPNTSLSLSARLFCYLGPPSTILLTSIASPKTGLLTPFAFLPTAWAYRKWQQANKDDPSRRGSLESMVWSFAAVGTIGLAACGSIQMGLGIALTYALFGGGQRRTDFLREFLRSSTDGLSAGELLDRRQLSSSWQNWVFMSVFSFFLAGGVEETLKYLPIAYSRRRSASQQLKGRKRAYIDYVLAGALGFGVVEGIGFLHAMCTKANADGPPLVVTVLERLVAGSTAHFLGAFLTALRATRRDFYGYQMSWWSIVGPSIFIHGAWDFVAFSCSALEGNVGWIHPTGTWTTTAMIGLLLSLLGTVTWQVKKEWQLIDSLDVRSKNE